MSSETVRHKDQDGGEQRDAQCQSLVGSSDRKDVSNSPTRRGQSAICRAGALDSLELAFAILVDLPKVRDLPSEKLDDPLQGWILISI